MESVANFSVEAIEKKEKEETEKKEREENIEKHSRKIMNDLSAQSRLNMKTAQKETEFKLKEKHQAQANQEEARKKALIYQLNLYLQRFPFLAEKVPIKGITGKSSVQELEEILYIVHAEMNSQKSVDRIKSWVDRLFLILETAWGDGTGPLPSKLPPPLRFNLSGISRMETEGAFNDDLIPLILEYDIEYPWLGRSNLTMRTLESLASIVTKVHIYNTNPIARKFMNLDKQAPVNLNEEDLKDL